MTIVLIRIWITTLTSFAAIGFSTLAYLFPKDSNIFLTLEVIILPTISIVGNYCTEEHIERKYKKDIERLTTETNALNFKLLEEKHKRIKRDILKEKR